MAKYDRWTTAEGMALLEGWARDGLTDEALCRKLGIASSTLYEWKHRHPEIAEALKKGKEVVDYQVESALLGQAMEGNVTAQIFWLKNRRPDKWRDKPEPAGDPESLTRARALLEGVASAID